MYDNESSSKGYWDRRNARMDADLTTAKTYAESPAGRLRKLERRYNLINYADRDAFSDADRAALDVEIAALRLAAV